MSKINIDPVKDYFLSLQDSICKGLEEADGKAKFIKDSWVREEGGGGLSRVIKNGNTFEQGGVNFSHVMGKSLPASATTKRPELANCPFEATGVSLVLHPLNPYVPTVHLNVRLFKVTNKEGTDVWWFGGGYDLTPYYPFEEDCVNWHKIAKNACDKFGSTLYPRFKKWADEYFYLKHRKEARGIGGIFFDDFNELGFNDSFGFVMSVGNSFLNAYLPIVNKYKDKPYTDRERGFQLYRRGRYVEFNLVYDRGTIFGLQSGGRTESILVSLPPKVSWDYNWHPSKDSQESKLYEEFLVPKDWIAEIEAV